MGGGGGEWRETEKTKTTRTLIMMAVFFNQPCGHWSVNKALAVHQKAKLH